MCGGASMARSGRSTRLPGGAVALRVWPLCLGGRGGGAALPLGAAALLGLGVALWIYPPAFLLGDAARFHSHTLTPNDAVEYTLAWRALAEHGDPWPALSSAIFNHPEGFSIALLDGLPLAATLARPLLGLLPAGFHYFGLWTALAVVLQGVSAVVLTRAAGVRSAGLALCAAALALTMPIFVGRLNQSHVALSTQGLLILALALAVWTTRRRVPLRRVFAGAAPLALTTLAVHPLLGAQVLLFAMLALLLAAAGWPARLAAAGALGGACASVGVWLGLFQVESLGNRIALGSFGFSPLGMLLGEPAAVREFHQSQGVEQDAWLGWGALLLLAATLFGRPRARLSNNPLAWLVLALTVVAVSPWVRHGMTAWDMSWLLPEFVIDLYAVHRATVRLAWPAVITLTLLPLAHVAATWPRRRVVVLLGVALPLQLWAAYPYWHAEHTQARLPTTPLAPPPPMPGATRLLVAPDIQPAGFGRSHLRRAMHLALESGVPLAGGVFARTPSADHAARRRAWRSAPPGAYYIVAAPARGPLPRRLPEVPVAVQCVRWETLAVCTPAHGPAHAMAPNATR